MHLKTKLGRRLIDLLTGEGAAEVTELAIVLALLIAGAIGLIAAIGPKIAAGYTALNSDMP